MIRAATMLVFCMVAILGPAPVVRAEGDMAPSQPDPELERLAKSSLEELMQVKVTTVVGSPQTRIGTPAAVYVISAEDIRRNGHASIAEALRMVPGMYVGRINSSSWLIGSRGLTGSALTATRYLVLVDIDRIEVIRGPGATLWGANAMNGVINIVTRTSEDTQGGDIPAMALTAFARGEDRHRALASGFQMHVAKPVEETELVAAVQLLVAHGQVANTPPDS